MQIRFLLLDANAQGGTTSAVLSLASHLAGRGHQVEVAAVHNGDRPRFPVDPRVRVFDVVGAYLRPGQKRRRLEARPSAAVPADERRYSHFSEASDVAIIRYLRSLHGGVLITTRPGLNLMSARYGSENVVRIGQEHLFLQRHEDKPRLLAAIAEEYPALDRLVCLTAEDARAYAERFGIRTEAIPNAVRFSVPPANADSLRDSRIVLAAGRLTGQKGFSRLVKAMALVGRDSGWEAHIYGEGDRAAELRELIDSTGAPVWLMGFTDDLPARMREAGIFAMTSRFEGFPMVMLEAMSVGLPVATMAFRTGCADLMTDGQTGRVVPQGDVPALAETLRDLMAQPEERVRMGRSAAAVAQGYTPDTVVQRWENLLARLSADVPIGASSRWLKSPLRLVGRPGTAR